MARLAAVAALLTLVGCVSGSTAPPLAQSQANEQVRVGGTDLASALDLVPDMPDGYAFYTDWSALGHRARPGSSTPSFAGILVSNDELLHHDLGIRSTDAQWELDVELPGKPLLVVLRFGARTDLSDVARKLTRLGYHAHGSVLTGKADPSRIWTLGLPNIGIDLQRHLLAGGRDLTAVRSVLAAPASPLGHAPAVTPLLALASAKLRHIATASVLVGKSACPSLAEMLAGKATPQILHALRERLHGRFTRPQAEITALRGPAGKIALDALTFPSSRAARANRAGRSAAQKQFSGLGGPNTVKLTGSAVTGRVLSFDLRAQQPDAVQEAVLGRRLGVDICP